MKRTSLILINLPALLFIFLLTGLYAQEKNVEEKRSEKMTVTAEKEEEKKQEEKVKKKSMWKNTVVGGVNFSQTSFSNWAKGGQNSIAWNISLDSDFIRNGGKWDWVIKNDMDFGMTKQEKEKARTTLDKIDIDMTVAYKAGSSVNPYLAVGLLTQFLRGYDYSQDPPAARSNFFDPAYITQDIGARVKVKNMFNSHLGIGLKQTVTRVHNLYSDDSDTPETERIKVEAGISSKSNLNASLFTNFNIKSELKLFKPFEKIEDVEAFEIDMNWNTKLTANITNYIVVTLNVYVYYEKDVLDKIQIREVAGIGLKYQFI